MVINKLKGVNVENPSFAIIYEIIMDEMFYLNRNKIRHVHRDTIPLHTKIT